MSVLAGHFEIEAVLAASRALATAGRTWDGSRLAAHAAGRAAEPKDMARLLACARELHQKRSSEEDGAAGAGPPHVPGLERARQGTGLSARERQVARLVLDGLTYREIGDTIFVSPRTAEHHIARIRRQLGAANRAELLAKLRLALDQDDSSSD
jgi:DNA-binding CsgD family transcriptional regulator